MDVKRRKSSFARFTLILAAALVVCLSLSAGLIFAEDDEEDDDEDVTGAATAVEPSATPTLTPTPEPTIELSPGVTASPTEVPDAVPTAVPTSHPAPQGGWPAANWAVVGVYGLILASSVPLLFRVKNKGF